MTYMPPANDGDSVALGWLWRAGAVLTQARPGYLTQRRETTRSWMLFVSLLLVLATVWLPQPARPSQSKVFAIVAVLVVTWLATLVRPWHSALNRIGGLIILAEIYFLVAFTGGEHSIYRPLYLGLLVYAALFYDRKRLIASFVLATVSLLMPALHFGVFKTAELSGLVTQVGMWFVVVVSVYVLTQRLRAAATRDGLTGLINHETFWRLAEGAHERFERYQRPYAVLLIDVDHFKQVNDTHGHRTGDRVLREVADFLVSHVRSADVVARYGGEEFTILLPETSKPEASVVAESLRRAVDRAGILPHVTISIGVASSEDAPASATAETLVQAADQALYVAKRRGRNRVSVTGSP